MVETTNKRHNIIVVMKKPDLGQVRESQELISHVKKNGSYKCKIPTKKTKKGRDVEALKQRGVDVCSL